jgi:hypothetical protein
MNSADLDTTTFECLSRLVSGEAGLAFQLASGVRFKDGFSIVLDHDELWTGRRRGAFELRFNDRGYHFNANIGFVANICRGLAPMPSSTAQSLLLHMPPWRILGYGLEWWAQARYAHWDLGNGNPWCQEILTVPETACSVRIHPWERSCALDRWLL